jgi:hypothetical protein
MTKNSTRRTPPETPEEWAYFWDGVEFGHLFGTTIAPIARVYKDWKFWAPVLAVVAGLNYERIIAAFAAMAGAG